jgi:hypothetical protein
MSYLVSIDKIRTPHRNAWNAVVNNKASKLTWKEIDSQYYDKYHVKLLRSESVDFRSHYEFLEFESEAAYFLFLLEWG